jgi:hypothetical protein
MPKLESLTALHAGTAEGHNVIVGFSLNEAQMCTLQGKDGATALHVAVQCESIQIIEQLLQSNASPKQEGQIQPMSQCVDDIVETLIEHSADPFLGDGYDRSGLD